MPSWNLHLAHAQRLLESREPCLSGGIWDWEAFKLGSIAPDIYVGYMVHHPSRLISYEDTHMAETAVIPVPDQQRFLANYVEPLIASENLGDSQWVLEAGLSLGAWSHLTADACYNELTRDYLSSRHLVPSQKLRKMKQDDFHLFGSTFLLGEDMELKPDSWLLKAACTFKPYALEAPDVKAACQVANRMVEQSRSALQEPGNYQLLDEEFFRQAFAATQNAIEAGLRWFADEIARPDRVR